MQFNLIFKPYKMLLFISVTLIIMCNNTFAMEEPKELIITDLEIGNGRTAVKGKEVAVHYTGWLYDSKIEAKNYCDAKGSQFDSSIERGMPFQLSLGQGMVIQGWEEGLIGMKEDGKRCLIIPPSMGYGGRAVGNGLIPANSTLIFEIILLGVR
jgi:FKBP-type peptidyl-prolyl cis-trans isomerase